MILGIVFLSCFILSGFFSAIEMAFVSSNRFKLRELADAGNLSAKTLLHLHDHGHQFLTMLLIGNNVVNVIVTTIVAYEMKVELGISNEWIVTAVTAPVLLILGEMVPKDYGRLQSQNLLMAFSGILRQFFRFAYYPTSLLLKIIDSFLRPFNASTNKSIFVNEGEFRSLIEESVRSGVVGHHEKRLIDTILDFERIHVESAMIPLARVSSINITGTIREVKEIARRTQTKMVLVYEEIPSLVVGMIYVFDLLFEENEEQGLKKYLRSPIFLQRNVSIEKAFLTLQEKRQSFAVVTDIHREVMGVVPIEKLLVL